jgi:hypothetical protein
VLRDLFLLWTRRARSFAILRMGQHLEVAMVFLSRTGDATSQSVIEHSTVLAHKLEMS